MPVATIMVVDDSIENLQFMETVLTGADYKVLVAPSGKLALRAIANSAPDLVLLDINMPEMNGYAVCREIRKDEQLGKMPVLFLSGSAGSDEHEGMIAAGGSALIAKPFTIQELLAKVSDFLNLE